MSAIEQVRAIVASGENLTAREVAERIGISKQRVSQICKLIGAKLRDGRSGFRPTRVKVSSMAGTDLARHVGNRFDPVTGKWLNRYGSATKMNAHFIGGASEMQVVADLLRQGIPVYRAVTFVSAADLVIDFDGRLLRVEVKSGRRNANGSVGHVAAPNNMFDVMAVALPDGEIVYRPSLGEFVEKSD